MKLSFFSACVISMTSHESVYPLYMSESALVMCQRVFLFSVLQFSHSIA